MCLVCTPDALKGAYQYLRGTKPFHAWKLPPPDAVEFAAINNQHLAGSTRTNTINGKGFIQLGVNPEKCYTSDYVVSTVAHEMCHMILYLRGSRTWYRHGKPFNQLAQAVCDAHGFDRKLF